MATTEQVLDLLQQRADRRGKVPMTPHEIAGRLGSPYLEVAHALEALKSRGVASYRERKIGNMTEYYNIRLRRHVTRDTMPGAVVHPHSTRVHAVGRDALDPRSYSHIAEGGPVTSSGPQHPPVPPDTLTDIDRVAEYVRRWQPDADGWVAIDSALIAGHFGWPTIKASRAIYQLALQGRAEVLKEGRFTIGLRLLERSAARARLTGRPVAAPPTPAEPQPSIGIKPPPPPAAPLIGEYREARWAAGRSRYLKFEPDPLAEEAVALLDWVEGLL